MRALFATVLDGVRFELDHRMGRNESHWVWIDAAHDDNTIGLLCTDESVLGSISSKPWAFTWPDEETMALDLGQFYQLASARLLAERQRDGIN